MKEFAEDGGTRSKTVSLFYKYSIVLILILICAVMSVLTSSFYSFGNLMNIVRQVAVVGLIAYGMTFVIISGGIDLSAGAVVAFVGVVVASMSKAGMPLVVVIPAGIALGALCGLVSGVAVSWLSIPPFIATLGLQQIARALALIYSKGRPISNFTDEFLFIGRGRIGMIPVPIIIFIVVGIICWVFLKKNKFGKHVYAIGGNELASVVCGIKVRRVKTMIYVIMGALTGLAAIVLTSRVSTGNPSVGSGYELDAITGVVIGGASLSGGSGSIFGTVIGSLIIGVLSNGLSLLGVSPYWQQFINGLLIISAVALDMFKNKYANR